MSKFKVGDIVRVRDWDDMVEEFGLTPNRNIDCKFYFTEEMRHLCGQTAKISGISGAVLHLTDLSGNCINSWTFSDDMLELVKVTDLFNPGYVCVLRDGTVCRFERLRDGRVCLSSEKHWCPVEDIDVEIMGYPGDPELDIMKIYGYHPFPRNAWACSIENRELIWERKEKKEMTIAEIEKELGYSVKIVKEK